MKQVKFEHTLEECISILEHITEHKIRDGECLIKNLAELMYLYELRGQDEKP